jgi:hypothetical protein
VSARLLATLRLGNAPDSRCVVQTFVRLCGHSDPYSRRECTTSHDGSGAPPATRATRLSGQRIPQYDSGRVHPDA